MVLYQYLYIIIKLVLYEYICIIINIVQYQYHYQGGALSISNIIRFLLLSILDPVIMAILIPAFRERSSPSSSSAFATFFLLLGHSWPPGKNIIFPFLLV